MAAALAGAAVASTVHRARQAQRALEGVLEHGEGDRRQGPYAAAPVPSKRPGPLDPLDALSELGGHRDCDDDRRPYLTQRSRHGLEQPLGIGEGVGCPDAGDHRRETKGLAESRHETIETDRSTQLDARCPRRQGDPGQRKDHEVADLHAHQDVQDHPDDHDEHPEAEVKPEGARPRPLASTAGDDNRRDPKSEQEQERVGRLGHGDGQPERPPPPRGGVERSRDGEIAPHAWASTSTRRRRAMATAPAARTSTRAPPTTRESTEPEPAADDDGFDRAPVASPLALLVGLGEPPAEADAVADADAESVGELVGAPSGGVEAGDSPGVVPLTSPPVTGALPPEPPTAPPPPPGFWGAVVAGGFGAGGAVVGGAGGATYGGGTDGAWPEPKRQPSTDPGAGFVEPAPAEL